MNNNDIKWLLCIFIPIGIGIGFISGYFYGYDEATKQVADIINGILRKG
jgi:ABC-type dipeptide/oligopeptide/nickel transport system permease subunit